MKPVAIIGGGISGLAAAYYLGREGIPSTLIEAEARLGGVIRTDRANGCLIEAGPDSWLARKPWALGLVRELGLENRVIGSNDDRRKTYVARCGKLIPIPQGMQLLTPAKPMAVLASRLFGIGTKLRMGLEWLRRPAEHPDRSVAEFVCDHFGDEWNERLAQPLLAAVYGGPPERLSVNCVLPALAEYERRYGSVVRGALKNRPAKAEGPLFLTLKDGLGTLVDALQKAVAPSSRLVRGRVLQIERAGGGWRVRLADGAVETEHVVAAVPAHEAAGLLRRSCGELAQVLDGIPYNSAVTAGLVYRRPGFDRPLDGFGMLIPRSEKLSPAACTWVETKFDHRTSDEATLLRVFFTGDAADELIHAGDDAVQETAHADLSSLMRCRARPTACRVNRWPQSMALYTVGHASRPARIGELLQRLPGLHLGGNGYDGVGIPDCIRRSQAIAAAIAGHGVGSPNRDDSFSKIEGCG